MVSWFYGKDETSVRQLKLFPYHLSLFRKFRGFKLNEKRPNFFFALRTKRAYLESLCCLQCILHITIEQNIHKGI